jgi:ABC-type phosphate transport system permease subunit
VAQLSTLGHITRMVILIFILLIATSAAYFTGIGCRRALARNRRPGWHLTFLGTCITTLLAALFVGQDDWFRPSRWDSGKVGILPVIMITFVAAVIALIASVIVVSIYRGKFRDDNHVA